MNRDNIKTKAEVNTSASFLSLAGAYASQDKRKNSVQPAGDFNYKKQHNYKYNKKYKKLGIFNRGNRTAQSRRYRNKYPSHLKAGRLIERLLRNNIIKKPEICSLCKKKRIIHAHHNL